MNLLHGAQVSSCNGLGDRRNSERTYAVHSRVCTKVVHRILQPRDFEVFVSLGKSNYCSPGPRYSKIEGVAYRAVGYREVPDDSLTVEPPNRVCASVSRALVKNHDDFVQDTVLLKK